VTIFYRVKLLLLQLLYAFDKYVYIIAKTLKIRCKIHEKNHIELMLNVGPIGPHADVCVCVIVKLSRNLYVRYVNGPNNI